MSQSPKLIQTYLPDGTLEGVRIIELSGSSVKAFVIPRLKLNTLKKRSELLQPALYFLISSETSRVYIGESENFLFRALNHAQNKAWWDVVVAIISETNSLEKSDIKYLESLAVERSSGGSMEVDNKTIPTRNTIHEFKLHILEKMLDDSNLILTFLNYDILPKPKTEEDGVWYLNYKDVYARGEYRGTQFVVLAGSTARIEWSESWRRDFPKIYALREDVFKNKSTVQGDIVTINDNVTFNSVSMAASIITGGHVNGWKVWKNGQGKTMDEVMRKEK